MRSSHPQNLRAQDDRLKNLFEGIFRIDPHAAFAAPDEDENLYIPTNFPL
jgi:hypothetical protein